MTHTKLPRCDSGLRILPLRQRVRFPVFHKGTSRPQKGDNMRFNNGQTNSARLNDYEGSIIALVYENTRKVPVGYTDRDTGMRVETESSAARAKLAVFDEGSETAKFVGTTLIFPQVIRQALEEEGPGGAVVGRLVRVPSERNPDQEYLNIESLDDDLFNVAVGQFEAALS